MGHFNNHFGNKMIMIFDNLVEFATSAPVVQWQDANLYDWRSRFDSLLEHLLIKYFIGTTGFLGMSGIAAGMVNICYAMYGNPVFSFSIVNSGDWIDKQAAKATGESISFINKEKTKNRFN